MSDVRNSSRARAGYNLLDCVPAPQDNREMMDMDVPMSGCKVTVLFPEGKREVSAYIHDSIRGPRRGSMPEMIPEPMEGWRFKQTLDGWMAFQDLLATPPADEMSGSDIVSELNSLCHPMAELMPDPSRLTAFVKAGHRAAAEITRLRAELDAAHAEKLEAKVKMTEAMIEARDLRARLAEAGAAKADAWDEAMKAAANAADDNAKGDAGDPWDDGWMSGCTRTAKDIRSLVNPYRSKTDG